VICITFVKWHMCKIFIKQYWYLLFALCHILYQTLYIMFQNLHSCAQDAVSSAFSSTDTQKLYSELMKASEFCAAQNSVADSGGFVHCEITICCIFDVCISLALCNVLCLFVIIIIVIIIIICIWQRSISR